MKKKLFTTMFALVMSISIATAMVGCDNGEHTHTYSEWTTVTEATCTTDGQRTRSCSCGETETETISATGHAYASEWTTDDTHHWKSATCEHTTEVSEKAEHNWGADDKCTVCQKEKPTAEPIYTITEEEWVAYFSAISEGMNYYCEQTVTGSNLSIDMIVSKYGNVLYQKQTVGTQSMEMYISFDDDTLSHTTYTYDTNNGWTSGATNEVDSNVYASRKQSYYLSTALFPYAFSTQQGGDKLSITELYSAFEFNEGAYTATLYANDSSETSFVYALTFENGKVVAYEILAGTQTLIGNISYDDFELVIPEEALNSGSQN